MATAPIRSAMILAAGRGERMRPLTDTTPKPLLIAGNKRLIEWQIEALVKAGIKRIIINHAWLGKHFEATLGKGDQYGCELLYSPETQALETAGGIARALPLLGTQPFIVVSGDIYSEFEYSKLPTFLQGVVAHLVLVANPPYHLAGDMGLVNGLIQEHASKRLTYANIGVFEPSMFKRLEPNTKHKLFPWLYSQGQISGEFSNATWHNVGTPEQLADLDTHLKDVSRGSNTPVDK
jgi:N-acetyl-alpha-D-muramate 1-phosphate uridylyltransferase